MTALKANICILLPDNKFSKSKAVFQQAIKTLNIGDWDMLDDSDNPPSRKKQRENLCLKEGSKLCPVPQQVVFLVRGVMLIVTNCCLLRCKSNCSEIWDLVVLNMKQN